MPKKLAKMGAVSERDFMMMNKKVKGPTKYQKIAMSKPVGKVLDSKVGKVGVKVGNKVIKAAKAPGKLLKRQWDKNQAFRNKNDTYEKFLENNKWR